MSQGWSAWLMERSRSDDGRSHSRLDHRTHWKFFWLSLLDHVLSGKPGNNIPKGEVRASLVAQMVKNPPAMQETWVQSMGWTDLLEKGTATHSSILAWSIPWAVYSLWGCKELDTTEWLSLRRGPQGYSPRWHLDCNPMGASQLMTHRNCEAINTWYFKSLSFRVICYAAKYNYDVIYLIFMMED